MMARAVAAKHGEEAAAEEVAKLDSLNEAQAKTAASKAEAARISERRERLGDGSELDQEAVGDAYAERRAQKEHRRRTAAERIEGRRGSSKVKQAIRERKKVKGLADRMQAARERDHTREAEQAEKMAEEAFQSHGIRHHYRPLPKVAWFAAYMAGLDRNGALAMRALASINMPAARMQQVLRAAFEPQGYQPKRNVCSGERGDQTPYELAEGRELQERDQAHPGAVRVIQCAIFLWVAKSRTNRRGFSGKVRGFGRGIFTSLCRCGKDAITGHADGVPGALVALRQAGFIQYGQPPSGKVAEIDRGPSGHAYNMFWLPQTAEERELDALHARVAEVARWPLLERLAADPASLRFESGLPPPKPPPAEISEADIPF